MKYGSCTGTPFWRNSELGTVASSTLPGLDCLYAFPPLAEKWKLPKPLLWFWSDFFCQVVGTDLSKRASGGPLFWAALASGMWIGSMARAGLAVAARPKSAAPAASEQKSFMLRTPSMAALG